MYYHLSNHIYITQFQKELILLNTKSDKYTICHQTLSDLIFDLLDEKNSRINKHKISSDCDENPINKRAYVQKLLNDKIIEERKSPFPFYIDRKEYSRGVSNVDWRLPLENKKVRLNIQVLNALLTLLRVNIYIKLRGFYPAIQLIKRSRNIQENYIIPYDEELRDLANIVNKACLIYPSRTKCLEWAITFVLVALKRKWKCNLEIGVQNYPFMAHAWVECDGKVVMDSPDLRDGLAIILNEPFRRIKV